jgi:Domain of unknown function (DUF4124)
MRAIRLWVATVALAAACGANAQSGPGQHNRYKWRDAQGNLHFDDVLPPEAQQIGYDIVNPQGLVIKHVDRLKTAEEMQADQAAADKAAKQKRAADDQARTDEQTLAAYPNEEELVGAQHAQLDMIDQNIHATEISLQSQEKSLTEMLSHAADLDRAGKPVPDTLKLQIDALRVNIEKQKGYITTKQQEKADAAKRFEVDLAHYREVQAQTKAQH